MNRVYESGMFERWCNTKGGEIIGMPYGSVFALFLDEAIDPIVSIMVVKKLSDNRAYNKRTKLIQKLSDSVIESEKKILGLTKRNRKLREKNKKYIEKSKITGDKSE